MPKGSIEWEDRPGEGLIVKLKPSPSDILSKEAIGHLKAAQKEISLAFKSVSATGKKRTRKNGTASSRKKVIKIE